MKIALIRKAYTPFGGAERHVARFIEALCARGDEVHVYAARWTPVEQSRDGAIVHRVPVVSATRWTEAWSFAVRASRMAFSCDYDVVQGFDRVRSCDIYRAGDGCHREWLRIRRQALPRWRRGVPFFNPLHLVYLALERGLFQGRCRVIVATSERGKAEILRHYGGDPARIRVVYNGVDLDRWRIPSAEERRAARRVAQVTDGQRLAILIGSGFERKGVSTAIRALARLQGDHASTARLAVIGHGRIGRYVNLARSLGVAERVSFVGPVIDVWPWYAAADALLVPTVYDPFANVVLEAMACGVPVVTSAAAGASEMLEDDAGAVVDDSSDADGFARAVAGIWVEGGDRAAACRRIAERFPISRHLDQMLAIYEEVRRRPTAGTGRRPASGEANPS